MNSSDHTEFWRLYDRGARPAIERACRVVSRSLTDNGMDPDEMMEWVDQRVWRMLERCAFPVFHDDPAAQEAADRLQRNAAAAARWAYLALSRRHWRQLRRRQEWAGSLSQAERLALAPARRLPLERAEQIDASLQRIRATLDENVLQKLAATWPEKSERHRVALALGATGSEDDQLIEETMDGQIKANTIDQMRSRARRRARAALGQSGSWTLGLAAFAAGAWLLVAAPAAKAGEGEQTGGGRAMVCAPSGEQTGGGRK